MRLPDVVDRDRQANCLDLTLLLAALCEQAGLRPLLILLPGHIVLGVWTIDHSFNEAVVPVASRVMNRATNEELILVESTAVTQGPAADFEAAREAAREAIAKKVDGMVAVDVARARVLRFLPLATRIDPETGRLARPVVSGGMMGARQPVRLREWTLEQDQEPARREGPTSRVAGWDAGQ